MGVTPSARTDLRDLSSCACQGTLTESLGKPELVASDISRRRVAVEPVELELDGRYRSASLLDFALEPKDEVADATRVLGGPVEAECSASLGLRGVGELAVLATDDELRHHEVYPVVLEQVVHQLADVLRLLTRHHLVHATTSVIELLPLARALGASFHPLLDGTDLRHPMLVGPPELENFLALRRDDAK